VRVRGRRSGLAALASARVLRPQGAATRGDDGRGRRSVGDPRGVFGAGPFQPAGVGLEEVRAGAPRRSGVHRRTAGEQDQPERRLHLAGASLRRDWRAPGAPGAARDGRAQRRHGTRVYLRGGRARRRLHPHAGVDMAARRPEAADRTFRLEVAPAGVGVVFMDVPGEPVNTLRADFAGELEELLRRAADDAAITSIVFASGKANGFIAGADVQALQRVRTSEEAAALSRGGQQAMARLEEIGKRKPIVAAIHGAALGGGLEVALACTYRIATDDRRTQ